MSFQRWVVPAMSPLTNATNGATPPMGAYPIVGMWIPRSRTSRVRFSAGQSMPADLIQLRYAQTRRSWKGNINVTLTEIQHHTSLKPVYHSTLFGPEWNLILQSAITQSRCSPPILTYESHLRALRTPLFFLQTTSSSLPGSYSKSQRRLSNA